MNKINRTKIQKKIRLKKFYICKEFTLLRKKYI